MDIENWVFTHNKCGGHLQDHCGVDFDMDYWECDRCSTQFHRKDFPIHKKIVIRAFVYTMVIGMSIQYAIWRWQDRRKK